MTDERLLLGGPAHGRRVAVDPGSYIFVVPIVRPMTFTDLDMSTDTPQVVYKRRLAPGGREWVFVAPDGYDTPEWLAFDTDQWAARALPDVTGWEHLGPWRWRGRPPEPLRHWRYLLGDGRGESHVSMLVPEKTVDLVDSPEAIFAEMQHEIDYQRLPTCVVPRCAAKALGSLFAAEPGRLANRKWVKDDEIKLCPPHYHDVLLAQGVYGLNGLPEWIRPDAMLGPLDAWGNAAVWHWGAESQTRMLHVYQKVGGAACQVF